MPGTLRNQRRRQFAYFEHVAFVIDCFFFFNFYYFTRTGIGSGNQKEQTAEDVGDRRGLSNDQSLTARRVFGTKSSQGTRSSFTGL